MNVSDKLFIIVVACAFGIYPLCRVFTPTTLGVYCDTAYILSLLLVNTFLTVTPHVVSEGSRCVDDCYTTLLLSFCQPLTCCCLSKVEVSNPVATSPITLSIVGVATCRVDEIHNRLI